MSHVMVVGTNMDAFIVYIDQQKLNGGIKAANKKLICWCIDVATFSPLIEIFEYFQLLNPILRAN